MLRDLRDAWSWIEKLVRRVERVESGAMLENSSITNGRMRFIGGLLRIDSGGQLQVIGEWRLTGTGAITGDVVAEGKWTQNGAWEFNGPGDIAGNVDLAGDMNVTGDIRILPGGKFLVGNMVIDPANGGTVTFPGGATVRGGSGGGVELAQGSYAATVTSGGASIGRSGLAVAVTDAAGIQLVGVPSGSPGNGTPANVYYRNPSGLLRVSDGS